MYGANPYPHNKHNGEVHMTLDIEKIEYELKRGNDVLIKACKDGYIVKSLASKELQRIDK